jgi:hypothetical protein
MPLKGVCERGSQVGQTIIKEGDAVRDDGEDGLYIVWEGNAQAFKGIEPVHDYVSPAALSCLLK